MSRSSPLRVLVIMRSPGFLRNFENALRALRGCGHEITVALERADVSGTYAPVRAALEREGVEFCMAPSRDDDVRHRAAVQVRLALDYLGYLDPRYDDRPKLRARAEAATFRPLRPVVRRAMSDDRVARLLRQGLRSLDVAAPVSVEVDDFLDRHPTDVLLVTPLVELGAPQTDWLRCAARRGLPTVLGVASWDNLTVKGRIREPLDLVLVWNDAQRAEAASLHGIPADRVVAVGAHTYDHWFERTPSLDRDTFCATVGLPAGAPFVLYLCSSPFIAPDEVGAVSRWLHALRSSDDPRLREAGILVRPHPQHAAQWNDVQISDLGPTVIWPPNGGDPVDESSRAQFFDSMHHCSAVVGVNTSALIESTIIGRQVLTVLDPQFAATQRGTLHFEHLADPDTGILTVAASMPEHERQLAAALRGDPAWEKRRIDFLESFVRPGGPDRPAAARFARAVEAVSPRPAADVRRTAALRLARLAWRLVPLRTAARLSDRRGRPLLDGLRPGAPLTVGRARRGPQRSRVLLDRLIEATARRAGSR